MKLSEAFSAVSGADAHLEAHGPGDVRVIGLTDTQARAVIDRWAWAIEVWWRQSPTAILECDRCGEIRLVGSKKSKKCHDTKRCAKAGGKQVALDPPFNTNRPRRKKIKL